MANFIGGFKCLPWRGSGMMLRPQTREHNVGTAPDRHSFMNDISSVPAKKGVSGKLKL